MTVDTVELQDAVKEYIRRNYQRERKTHQRLVRYARAKARRSRHTNRLSVLQYIKENYPEHYARKAKSSPGQMSLFDEDAHPRAKEPVSIGGTDYKTGQWVPKDKAAEATEEQQESIELVDEDTGETEDLDDADETAEISSEEYFGGNKIELTGNTADLSGGKFEEFVFLEGPNEGQTGYRPTAEQKADNVEKSKSEWREQQEGFRRVREAEKAKGEPQQEPAEPKPEESVNLDELRARAKELMPGVNEKYLGLMGQEALEKTIALAEAKAAQSTKSETATNTDSETTEESPEPAAVDDRQSTPAQGDEEPATVDTTTPVEEPPPPTSVDAELMENAKRLTGEMLSDEVIAKADPTMLQAFIDRQNEPKTVISSGEPPGGWSDTDKVPSEYAQKRNASRIESLALESWNMTEADYRSAAENPDELAYKWAINQALKEGKDVPDEVLDQGDGRWRMVKNAFDRRAEWTDEESRLFYAKVEEMTIDEYLEHKRLKMLEKERSNYDYHSEALKRMVPKTNRPASIAKAERESAKLKIWAEFAQKKAEELEALDHGRDYKYAEQWANEYRKRTHLESSHWLWKAGI